MAESDLTELVTDDYLSTRVVKGGYCIGCGACASLDNSPFQMEMDAFGLYTPVAISGSTNDPRLREVCPFGTSLSEDHLADKLYQRAASYDRRVGYYSSIYVGHVTEGQYREKGSSGGVVTWLLCRLLDEGVIDGVIHVGSSASGAALFSFGVSSTKSEIIQKAKSRYYPNEFSRAVRAIRSTAKRYAFVGVPCHIKAIRLLAEQDVDIKERVACCIAIFCGHMKSAAYSEMIAWQHGVQPGALRDIDFRVKLPERPASAYGVEVVGVKDGESFRTCYPVGDLYGTNWGVGLFKPKACDYCDDIAGELADVSCGDAWIPPYSGDPKGNSVIIARTDAMEAMLAKGLGDGTLRLDVADPSIVYETQAGNYRHRREGLSCRLERARARGVWCPPKRVSPGEFNVTWRRRALYALRERLAERSHDAFLAAKARHSLAVFFRKMALLEIAYHFVNLSIRGYVARRVKIAIRSVLGAGVSEKSGQ